MKLLFIANLILIYSHYLKINLFSLQIHLRLIYLLPLNIFSYFLILISLIFFQLHFIEFFDIFQFFVALLYLIWKNFHTHFFNFILKILGPFENLNIFINMPSESVLYKIYKFLTFYSDFHLLYFYYQMLLIFR
jgi:hypothetical protein